jgi:FAD-linked oxidoreductase
MWRNWVGYQECEPARFVEPAGVAELAEILKTASTEGHAVRVVGSGHSFTPLVPTDGVLISLDKFTGLVEVDKAQARASIRAGTKLHHLGPLLWDQGLGLENQGDIDRQSIAGAVSTGTHGTGIRFGSISNQVQALRLMTAVGEEVSASASENADLFEAARVSFGSLGILTELTLQLVPSYNLKVHNGTMNIDECLRRAPELIAKNRHFEFFWFPHQDLCVTKALNDTDEPRGNRETQTYLTDVLLQNNIFGLLCRAVRAMPALAPSVSRLCAKLSSESTRVSRSYRLLSTVRTVRFQEMEYAFPAERGAEVLREVRDYIATKKIRVNFPVEYRWVKGDTIWLSPDYGRDSVHISVHQFQGMPWLDFFQAVEAIFRNHGGRPHWGKWHSQGAKDLKNLYPRWNDFLAMREKLDPEGRFLNPHLRHLFGLDVRAMASMRAAD